MSFAADTRVLLADGTTKPIADIEVGDEVLAADPVDGTQAARPVEAVHVHDDALVDLVVDGAVLRTSEDHPFWSVTDQQFERADHLTPGEEVLTATGTTATIDGLDVANSRYAPAHNLTITDLHTYYVVAGTTSALVHNCGGANANTGRADFIASADGVVVPTSRSRLVTGFDEAGLPSTPTTSAGTQYTLPDGSLVRVMEPSGQAGLRASFTNANGGPINPFTGKPVQPPPGLSMPDRLDYIRSRTHIELGP